MKERISNIDGLIAATFTPLKQNGQINFDAVGPYVEFLIRQGVVGIYLCGSTGEGPSLTVAERKELAGAFVNAAAKRLVTFVHVGHESLKEAAGLARHAAEIGADAISAAPPSYFKVRTTSALLASVEQIANHAPDLPFYYYHIPVKTGVDLDMAVFLERAAGKLTRLRGIKYTSYQLDMFQRCQMIGSYDMLFGRDDMFLSALVLGCKGFIGSTYNFMAPLYRRMLIAFEAEDLLSARDLQAKVSDLVAIINRYGGLPPQKIMMRLAGVDCGPVRLPLENLDATGEKKLIGDLTKSGFLKILELSSSLN